MQNNHPPPDSVRIHIDREEYQSPNPTTAAALYALGEVPPHHELFREVGGNHEDEFIRRDALDIHLAKDEHFYSQNVFDIVINTEPKQVLRRKITFEQLVAIAAMPSGPNILITIDYAMGPPENPQGSLRPGRSVRVKDGMVFDVVATDRS